MHAEQWAKACVQTKAAGHSAAMRRSAGRRARGRNRTPENASAGLLSGCDWRGFCGRFASPRAIRAPTRHQPDPGRGGWLAAGASEGCDRRQGRCARRRSPRVGRGTRGGRKREGDGTHSGAPAGTWWRYRQNRVHFRLKDCRGQTRIPRLARIAASPPAMARWYIPAGLGRPAREDGRPLRKQAHRCAIQLP
jgi:hypothetical protein